jgi:hypothetical protein
MISKEQASIIPKSHHLLFSKFAFQQLSKTEPDQFKNYAKGIHLRSFFEQIVKIIHICKVDCEIRKLQQQNLF